MKRYEFWLCGVENLIVWPIYFAVSIGIMIIGIPFNNEASLYYIMVGIILDIIYILIILFHPKVLAKIIFTTEDITLKRFNKELVNIKWEDIINIDEKCVIIGTILVSFNTTTNKIEISPTKKFYNAIMYVCPYESFKHIINELEAFKCYHRKKKNKKTGD